MTISAFKITIYMFFYACYHILSAFSSFYINILKISKCIVLNANLCAIDEFELSKIKTL